MPFAPSSLFTGGYAGYALDPLDLTKVFQDSAGTTGGAVGSPIGLLDDISGNGNNFSQATSAARPTLQSDGFDTNGSSTYLQLNGVDLYTPGAATFVFRVQGAAGQLDCRILGMGNSGSTALIYEPGTGTDSVSSGNLRYFVRTSVGTVLQASATGGGLDGTWHTVAITDTGSAVDLYIDGTHIEQHTYTRGSNSLVNDRTALGCLLRTSAGNFFNGRIGRVIGIARVLSGTDLTNATNWVSNTSTGATDNLVGGGTSAFAQSSAISRTRGFVASSSAAFSESSTLKRTRGFVSSVAEAWSEAASLVRSRGLPPSVQAQSWGGSSTLSRKRGCNAAASEQWSSLSTLSRARPLGTSSAAASWSETATFGAGSVWHLAAAGAVTFGESSAIKRVRGFIASASISAAETSSLSRVRGLTANGNIVAASLSTLSKRAALGASGGFRVAQSSALSRSTFLGSSTVASLWSLSGFFGATVIQPAYPLQRDVQAYPLTQAQTYPLAGIPQQYPLAS